MADLPINYGDTGKVARDKINDSFDAVVATVEGYRPHIESGIRWIGDTNTGVKAEGDSIVMKAEDGYIWYKSDSNDWSQIIAISDLKGDKGDPGEQGNPGTPGEDGEDGNGITSVTSTKVGKTTTVTMNFDEGDPFSFEVQDGQDGGGGGGSGDVVGPDSSTDGHLAVFDGATGKAIKDGGVMPTIPTKTSDLTNDSGFITSSALPTKVSDLTNDAGYLTSSTGVTSFNGQTGAVTYTAPVSSVNNQTGAVTVLESQTKVFTMPEVGDSVSDILTWLGAGKVAILKDGNIFYQIVAYNTVYGWIAYSYIQPANNITTTDSLKCYTIYYDTTTLEIDTKDDRDYILVPTGGSNGQVLTATSSTAVAWQAPSGGDVVVSSQTGNILQSGMKIWAGLETDYQNLGSHDQNTLYLTVE